MNDKQRAAAEFRRTMLWIAALGVIATILALWYLSLFRPLRLPMVLATVGGVFFSILLGCGLFAAAFYSEKSGHDQKVTDATRGRDRPTEEIPDSDLQVPDRPRLEE